MQKEVAWRAPVTSAKAPMPHLRRVGSPPPKYPPKECRRGGVSHRWAYAKDDAPDATAAAPSRATRGVVVVAYAVLHAAPTIGATPRTPEAKPEEALPDDVRNQAGVP